MKTETKRKRGIKQTHEEFLASEATRKREAYRKRAVKLRNCRSSLRVVTLASRERELYDKGLTPCLSTLQLAKLMGYHHVSVARWQGAGIFPKPPHRLAKGYGSMFSVDQAKQICDIMADHQRNSQYLYSRDTKVIAALFAATA